MRMMVFLAGKYPQGDFSEQVVQQIAQDYEPEQGVEAPCVIGHFDNLLAERIETELSDGWVSALQAVPGDQGAELWAEMELSADLIGLVRDKKLRYVSIELMESKDDSGSASWQLYRVAFLGRTIPQIKTAKIPSAFRWLGAKFGLKFGDDDGEKVARFSRKIDLAAFRGVPPGGKPTEEAIEEPTGKPDGTIEEFEEEEENEVAKITEEQFAAAETRAAESEARAKEAEDKLAQFQAAAEKKDVEAKLRQFEAVGKLPPAELEQALGLALQLRGEYREQYFQQIEARPPALDLSGRHQADKSEFSEAGLDPMAQVRKFASDNKISFSEAVDRIRREQPDLYEKLQATED